MIRFITYRKIKNDISWIKKVSLMLISAVALMISMIHYSICAGWDGLIQIRPRSEKERRSQSLDLDNKQQEQGNHEGINPGRLGNGLTHEHGSCQEACFLGVAPDGFTRLGGCHAFTHARADGA
ncbi:hypothetical protein DESC_730097 [Desulfosarcina cetonica]|nr:hypothetical protein DESC_730097 [Desulfosarcina cetonica]